MKLCPFEAIHPDLLAAQKLAYDPSGLFIGNLTLEAESQEYGACRFDLNQHRVVFRVAKQTPKKVGMFVTFWKRIEEGPIMPFDRKDPLDLFIVSVRSGERFGQFVFPKTVLCDKGVVSSGTREGKRGIRVYPPWDSPESRQATRTQLWQCEYFSEIKSGNSDLLDLLK